MRISNPLNAVYTTHNVHNILRETLCSNRIAIIPEKSEYVYTERENTQRKRRKTA